MPRWSVRRLLMLSHASGQLTVPPPLPTAPPPPAADFPPYPNCPPARDPFPPLIVSQITEKIVCSGSSNNSTGDAEWVRILLNDAPFPITTCGDAMDSKTGACPLSVFVRPLCLYFCVTAETGWLTTTELIWVRRSRLRPPWPPRTSRTPATRRSATRLTHK